MTTQRKIELLQKAKTKFDMAYALNLFEPQRYFAFLLDVYLKADFLRLKEEFLKKYATPDSHNIKKSLKTKKFNVAVSAKYNHTRLSMNDNGYILLDGSIYDYDEYLRGVRLNKISAIPQPHNNALSLV